MVKLEKLDIVFQEDGQDMDVFLFTESTEELIPKNSFVFDYTEKETKPEVILSKFVECLSKGDTDIIKETVYTPDEISNIESHATKFLRQLRRDLTINKLL